MSSENEPFGSQNLKEWQDISKWPYKNHVIKERVNAEDAFLNL